MNILEAIVLGIVQGLTEFLPISSTAHLTILGRAIGLISEENAAAWTAFLAVVQLGTLAAVLVYFFRDLLQMPRSVMKDLRDVGLTTKLKRYSPSTRTAILIVIGTIPVGVAGLLLADFLHAMFTKNLVVIGSSLIGLALLLWLAERFAKHTRSIDELTVRDTLIIGVAQAFALIPGSSRSGTTITAGLFLNMARHSAARFSFLLSIPAVMASGLYEMFSLEADPFAFGTIELIIATVVSAVSGYAAIAWLLRFLMTKSTMIFVWYRIALGAILLGLSGAAQL